MSLQNRMAPAAWVLVLVAAGSLVQASGTGPEDRSYRAGIGLLNKGLHELAASELRTFLKEHPEAPEALNARYALGVCLSRTGDHGGAAAELDRVIAMHDFEFRADAMLLRSHGMIARGEDGPAAELLARLAAEYPKWEAYAAVLSLEGETLYRLGKYEDAGRVLERAVDRLGEGEGRYRAEVFLALSAAAMGEDRPAAERLASLRERNAGTVLGPTILLAEARCRHRMGETGRAGELYEQAARGGDSQVKAEAMFGLGQVARESGEPGRATEALGEVLSLKVGGRIESAARLELGRISLDAGRTDDAAKIFRAIEEKGDASLADDAAYWQAKCDLKAGRFDIAAKGFLEAAERFPSSELAPEMKFDAVSATARDGDDEEAAAAWKSWRNEYPRHALASRAAAGEAASLQRLGKYAESLRVCDELLGQRLPPEESAYVGFLRGENLFLSERYGEAEASFAALARGSEADPSVWRAAVRRGMCLLKLGRGDEAQQVLSAALVGEGDGEKTLRAAAISQLGEYSLSKEDWKSAQAQFAELARLVRGEAGEADALLREGLAVSRQGGNAEAVKLFDRAAALDPASACGMHAQFEKGQALVELGRLDEAGAAFGAVIEREKAGGTSELTPHAVRHLAAIASRSGDPKRAAELLGEIARTGDPDAAMSEAMALMAAGSFAEAESAFGSFIKEHAGHARAGKARAMRAVCVNREGRHEEAIQELAAVDAAALGQEAAGSVLYEKALALRALKRDDEAADAYRRLLEGTPSARLEAYSALDLAQLMSEKGDHGGAVKLLDRCETALRSVGPADSERIGPRARYARGICLLGLDKPREAAGVLEGLADEAIERDLGGPVASALGEALLKCGRAQDAVKVLGRAVEDATGDAAVSAALLRLGEACAAAQQWKGSDEAYTRFLEGFGSSELWFQARFGQGWARENQGRHDAAVEAYRDVVERHQGPTAARAQFQIGECLFAQKKYDAAVAELLKVDVLYSYPQWSAAALYEAGRCLAELNKTSEAVRQFDDLIARFPETSWAQLARERKGAIRPEGVPGRPREVTRAK